MTGEVAANDAGPSVVLSYVVAGVACVLAAFCYSEFASMAPVAGSIYAYAYATLGEGAGLDHWLGSDPRICDGGCGGGSGVGEISEQITGCTRFLPGTCLFVQPGFTNPGTIIMKPPALILIVCTIILVIENQKRGVQHRARLA